jgi:hypothetical protein
MGIRKAEKRDTRARNGIVRRATRRLIVAVCAMAIAYSLLAAVSSAAGHGWSPAVAVGGPQIQDLLFGPANVPWVVFGDEPVEGWPLPKTTPQVARLTSRYAFVDRRRIPGVLGYESSVRLYVNRRGVGAVLSTLTPLCDGCLAPPQGVGVSAWRPGQAPSQPLVLTGNVQGGASIAINAAGTTAVSYATWEKEHMLVEHPLVVDRLSGGRIVGVQEIPTQVGDLPVRTQVLAASGGGFRAEWELLSQGLAGIETAEVSAGGLFSPGVFVPWPYESNAPRVSVGIFRSNARGDEVVLWPAKEPPFREGVERVTEWDLASRSAGGTWSSPQLIGTTGAGGDMAVTIGPTGSVSVVWPSAESRMTAVGGTAGGPVSSPAPLQPHPTGLRERFVRLAMTTTGRVVAVWHMYGRSEESSLVEAATSKDGVHFSRPRRISLTKPPMRDCLNDLLVPDRAGGALAWWSCENGRLRVNEYARYRP